MAVKKTLPVIVNNTVRTQRDADQKEVDVLSYIFMRVALVSSRGLIIRPQVDVLPLLRCRARVTGLLLIDSRWMRIIFP